MVKWLIIYCMIFGWKVFNESSCTPPAFQHRYIFIFNFGNSSLCLGSRIHRRRQSITFSQLFMVIASRTSLAIAIKRKSAQRVSQMWEVGGEGGMAQSTAFVHSCDLDFCRRYWESFDVWRQVVGIPRQRWNNAICSKFDKSFLSELIFILLLHAQTHIVQCV